MKKVFLAGALVAVVIGLALIIASAKHHSPARLVLPDGTTVCLVGATGGEGYKGSSVVGALMSPLPGQWQQAIATWSDYQIYSGTLLSVLGKANLCVFVARKTNSISAPTPIGGYYSAYLADDSNFISGEESDIIMWNYLQDIVGPVQFQIFPRRSRELSMHIFYYAPTGKVSECGVLTFANPRFHKYPEWKAETLPVTKQAGDLEVTLLGLHTGFDNHTMESPRADGEMTTTHGTNRLDGRNYTAVELKVRPLGNTNEVWQVAGAEVSDATGNRATSTGLSWEEGASFSFMPGLWLDESAWKLKLQLKRKAGWRPEELLIFRNVPLGEVGTTNYAGWVTNCAGVTVGLQRFERRAPSTGSSWSSSELSRVALTNSALEAGVYLDLVGAVFEAGQTNLSDGSSTSDREQTYGFRQVPAAAQTADFIFAVQQGRTVEFTVKPQLPKPEQISRE